MDQVLAIERRRRNLRIVLFIIILATLPFYCAGFLLWATAPQRGTSSQPIVGTTTATFTPISGGNQVVTNTPFGLITPISTLTSQSPLQPTPGQFVPPAVTRYLSPTPFLFPTLTTAPTLTPFVAPTFTPLPTAAPPTQTPFVEPTAVPPTNTDVPPPTPLPFPTDTPIPLIEPPTAESPPSP